MPCGSFDLKSPSSIQVQLKGAECLSQCEAERKISGPEVDGKAVQNYR